MKTFNENLPFHTELNEVQYLALKAEERAKEYERHELSLRKIVAVFSNDYFLRHNDGSEVATLDGLSTVQTSCKSLVPAIMAEEPNTTPKPKRDFFAQYNELAPFREILEKQNLSDYQLKGALRVLAKHHTYFTVKTVDGELRAFEGMKKGVERYNKKQRAKIMDTMAELTKAEYEMFFVTTTFDPESNGHNRYDAWANYDKNIRKIFENARKHHGVKILWVTESTLKGYPHIHAIVCFPKGTYKGYDKLPFNKKLTYGSLPNALKNNPVFKVFDVVKPNAKGLKYYLTKYISKATTQSIFELAEKKEPFTSDERKMLQGLIYTTMCRVRMVGIPRLKLKDDNEQVLESNEVQSKKEEYEPITTIEDFIKVWKEQHDFARLRASLIRICTNFPCKEKCRVRFQSFKSAKKILNGKIGAKEDLSTSKWEELDSKGFRLGCVGCFFSHLSQFVLTGKDELINIFLYNTNNKPVYWFEESDFLDDKLYMQKLIGLIDFYTRFTKDTCCSLLNGWNDAEKRMDYMKADSAKLQVSSSRQEQIAKEIVDHKELTRQLAEEALWDDDEIPF